MAPFRANRNIDLRRVEVRLRDNDLALDDPLLLEDSRRAAAGRLGRTVLDPSVRRAWENEDVEIVGLPAGELAEIVEEATRSLGLPARVRVRLAKVAVYERGGFFAVERVSIHTLDGDSFAKLCRLPSLRALRVRKPWRLGKHARLSTLRSLRELLSILERNPVSPTFVASAKFLQAQAQWDTGGDRGQARERAQAALALYAEHGEGFDEESEEIRTRLAEHGGARRN